MVSENHDLHFLNHPTIEPSEKASAPDQFLMTDNEFLKKTHAVKKNKLMGSVRSNNYDCGASHALSHTNSSHSISKVTMSLDGRLNGYENHKAQRELHK